MNITLINKNNLNHFKGFITNQDANFIKNDYKIIPIGLVADDLDNGKNMAAGAICLRPDDYELKITSFYVSPEYRGKGAGKYLLDKTKRILGDKDMEFDIEFLIYGKEEENLAQFLEDYGFSYADPEYEALEMTVVELEKTKLSGKKGTGTPFSKIPSRLFDISQAEAIKKGAILPFDGLDSESIEKDISVGIVKDDLIESYVAFEKLSDTVLLLAGFHVGDNNTATLLHMLEASMDRILDKYPGYARIIIQPVNEVGSTLADSIYEDARDISCRYRYVI